MVRAYNFYFIHGFPDKKYFINKSIKIALFSVGFVEFFFWILDKDARRFESI